MAKEIDIKLKTTADKSGVQIISGSLKGLKATAAEVSSSVIFSARQINERWREYWRSTRENATKELSKISTTAQKEGDKVGVCISGGKDSMLLALCFKHLHKYSKFQFDLEYIVSFHLNRFQV